MLQFSLDGFLLVSIILLVIFIAWKLSCDIADFKKAKTVDGKIKAINSMVSVPVILFLLFGFYSYISFVYIDTSTQASVVQNYDYSTEEYVSQHEISDTIINDLNVLYWNNIPESQREILQNNWILIVDEKLPSAMQQTIVVGANEYDKTGLILGGLTYTQKRLIFVNCRLEYETFKNSYIHEHGHALSYELGTLHGSLEWKNLYNKYKNSISKEQQGYYTSDAAEFFAWSYAEYFTNADKLQNDMPEIYEYMDAVNHTEINNGFMYRLLTGIKGICNLFIYNIF